MGIATTTTTQDTSLFLWVKEWNKLDKTKNHQLSENDLQLMKECEQKINAKKKTIACTMVGS